MPEERWRSAEVSTEWLPVVAGSWKVTVPGTCGTWFAGGPAGPSQLAESPPRFDWGGRDVAHQAPGLCPAEGLLRVPACGPLCQVFTSDS